MRNTIKLTESGINRLVTESVLQVLNELDWKTYINASRKRKEQGLNQNADELERNAQKMFDKQYGRNGNPHNYDWDSPEYEGRRHHWKDRDFFYDGDVNFKTKNPVSTKYRDWDGEDVEEREYRWGKGEIHRNGALLHNDTAQVSNLGKVNQRRHTFRYDKHGERYEPELSTVGNEISVSKDPEFNRIEDKARKDLNDYYTGKSKYDKNKGWK